jgi:hypothetical protein
MSWFRCCYRFKTWRHRIGWPDGYAREHWISDRDACQASIDAVIARGGEAFMETK